MIKTFIINPHKYTRKLFVAHMSGYLNGLRCGKAALLQTRKRMEEVRNKALEETKENKK